MNRTLNEIRNHTYIEPNGMTLAEWLRIWLDTYCRNTLRPSTFVNYEIYLDKHITPTIGNIRLTDLNAVILQQFYNDKLKNGNLLTKGGLKPKTLRNMHNMLHKALGQAYRMDMIPKNPADFVSIPRQNKQERKYLTVEEQQLLQRNLKSDTMGIAILLDLKDRETLLEIGYPKTPHSIRNIPLLPEIAERLRIYKAQQAHNNSINGILPSGYVFTNRAGNWIDPRDFQRDFKQILRKAASVKSMCMASDIPLPRGRWKRVCRQRRCQRYSVMQM